MEAKKVRTRQEFFSRIHPRGKDFIIGLDGGYSGMKVFYENGYFCFPSYAKKITSDMLDVPDEKDIMYRDLETGDVYMIGYTAQNMIASMDTNDTDGELYGRKRYGSRMFRILCNTAIGIPLLSKKDGREVVIQTGLPASYVKGDNMSFQKMLSKPAQFELKIGTGSWQRVNLNLKENNIHTDMAQPAGSLYSVLIKNDGKYIPDARHYLMSNILVVDLGFGTGDIFGLKNRAVAHNESMDDVGMRNVLIRTSKSILNELGEDIRVQALQKNLESGKITCVNEEDLKAEDKPIAPFLEQSSEMVFKDAMERLKTMTNAFRDYQFLIVTGGTGEAWYEKIKEYLSGLKNLVIIPGNSNDANLPFMYANVRGYYLFRCALNKR